MKSGQRELQKWGLIRVTVTFPYRIPCQILPQSANQHKAVHISGTATVSAAVRNCSLCCRTQTKLLHNEKQVHENCFLPARLLHCRTGYLKWLAICHEEESIRRDCYHIWCICCCASLTHLQLGQTGMMLGTLHCPGRGTVNLRGRVANAAYNSSTMLPHPSHSTQCVSLSPFVTSRTLIKQDKALLATTLLPRCRCPALQRLCC